MPCGDSDHSQLCVALKYVAYSGGSSPQAMVSRNQASYDVSQVNSIWSQCRIEFFVEEYAAINPSSRGLAYQPASDAELQRIRSSFGDSSRLLVVTTGTWSGELGAAAANAWTVLPSVGPFGVVMEAMAGAISNLIAHELGHYLNLEHAEDVYNAMNPIIYTNSLNLTEAQCAEARATAISFWGATLR
jgi:hypothetical protein